MKKNILFDFDGTLANTLEAAGKILNNLSSKYGYKRLTEEEMLLLKEHSMREMLREMQISLFKLPFTIKDVKEGLSQEMKAVEAFSVIPELLLALKKKDYSLGIVTSNSRKNVDIFLKSNNITSFDFIISNAGLFGKSLVLRKFLKQRHMPNEQVIYIGDEVRDIEAARKANIQVIAVSWGINSVERLKLAEPDFLVQNTDEILKVLVEL